MENDGITGGSDCRRALVVTGVCRGRYIEDGTMG